MSSLRRDLGAQSNGGSIGHHTPRKLVKNAALGLGVLALMAAFVHGLLWSFMKSEYLSSMEAILSPDGEFLYPELALAWCLAALWVVGAAGIYTGIRNVDAFNLPEKWRPWQVCFVIWMGFCAIAPFVLDIKIRNSEDGFLEWFTFWADGIAGLTVAFIAVSSRSKVLLLVAIILCFLAGEEISWGQRVFGFATPEGLKQLNNVEEANLHNLLPVLNLGYLVVFTLAAILASEIKGVLGTSFVQRVLSMKEQGLLIRAVDLPFIAVILLFIGLVAGHTDEFAEYLFACFVLASSIRLVFISTGQAPETDSATNRRSDE